MEWPSRWDRVVFPWRTRTRRSRFRRVPSSWPCWLIGHDWRWVQSEVRFVETEHPDCAPGWTERRLVWWCARCPETTGQWEQIIAWDRREVFNGYAKLPRVIEET